MKNADPRLKKAERLLGEALRLICEIKAGVPAPRARRRPRRFRTDRIISALRDGASFGSSVEDRDPRLPCRTTVARYRKLNSKFDRQVRELGSERRTVLSNRSRVSPNPGASVWARRAPGQSYNWEQIAAKIEAGATIGPKTTNRQGLPCHTLIMARRKADPIFAARVAAVLERRCRPVQTPVDRDTVLELIRRGAVIKASPPNPGMPTKHILDRRRHNDSSFDGAMRAAIAEARRRRFNRRRLAKLPPGAALATAEDAVPRSLEPCTRDDIVGELTLQICSGEVAVGGDLTAAWKSCRTRLTAPRWKEASLDSHIPGTEGLTRIDLLRDDAEHL